MARAWLLTKQQLNVWITISLFPYREGIIRFWLWRYARALLSSLLYFNWHHESVTSLFLELYIVPYVMPVGSRTSDFARWISGRKGGKWQTCFMSTGLRQQNRKMKMCFHMCGVSLVEAWTVNKLKHGFSKLFRQK